MTWLPKSFYKTWVTKFGGNSLSSSCPLSILLVAVLSFSLLPKVPIYPCTGPSLHDTRAQDLCSAIFNPRRALAKSVSAGWAGHCFNEHRGRAGGGVSGNRQDYNLSQKKMSFEHRSQYWVLFEVSSISNWNFQSFLSTIVFLNKQHVERAII